MSDIIHPATKIVCKNCDSRFNVSEDFCTDCGVPNDIKNHYINANKFNRLANISFWSLLALGIILLLVLPRYIDISNLTLAYGITAYFLIILSCNVPLKLIANSNKNKVISELEFSLTKRVLRTIEFASIAIIIIFLLYLTLEASQLISIYINPKHGAYFLISMFVVYILSSIILQFFLSNKSHKK